MSPGSVNSCLVVIDVQKGIFELKQPVHDASGLVDRLKASIESARISGIQVVFTQHENPTFLKEGSRGWQIVDELKPSAGEAVIRKSKASAFDGTSLGDVLEGADVSCLIVGGLISNGCIEATCLDALKLGYDVVLIEDAHSTFYKQARKVIDATNRELAGRGVTLRRSVDVF